jgi:hypothetical protein
MAGSELPERSNRRYGQKMSEMANTVRICCGTAADKQRHFQVDFLFPNNIPWVFIASQAQKDGLAELAVVGPLGKLDLGHQPRLDPSTALRSCLSGWRQPWSCTWLSRFQLELARSVYSPADRRDAALGCHHYFQHRRSGPHQQPGESMESPPASNRSARTETSLSVSKAGRQMVPL